MPQNTMKAARLYGARDIRFSDEPLPDIQPDEVLLRIRAVGICASDVHYYNEGAIGDAVVKSPLVLGHEVGAEVAAVGAEVKSLQPGDIVAVEPGRHCGHCELCLKGLINLCPNVRFFGTPPVDGALREYVAWPEEQCLRIPPGMSAEEAAMTEPMAVGIYAVELADLKGGDSVAILGAGAIGLSVMQAARVMGAGRIWIVDPLEDRCQLASKLGADKAIVGQGDEALAAIREDNGGRGPDVVFECAGSNDAVEQGVRLVNYDGRLIVAGIPFPDEVRFAASVARRKNLTVKFVRRSRNAVQRALDWCDSHQIDLASYVTHRFPLDKTGEALELARQRKDGVLRAVVMFPD